VEWRAVKSEVVDEHGNLHYYTEDVLQALAAVGLIWQVGDTWVMDTTRVDLGQWPELAICDFCSGRPVTWDIAADDFAIVYPGVVPIWRSTHGWMACEACGGLIAAGDRPALDARALAFMRAQVPAGQPIAPYLAAERELLRQFWRHYRGIRRYPSPYAKERVIPDCDCRNPRCGHKASKHVGPGGECIAPGCGCGPGGWV
jgi:hypothetical protein